MSNGIEPTHGSRRHFLTDVSRLASTVALASCVPASIGSAQAIGGAGSGDWDLTWIATLRPATDHTVFDWPSIGDPADPIVL